MAKMCQKYVMVGPKYYISHPFFFYIHTFKNRNSQNLLLQGIPRNGIAIKNVQFINITKCKCILTEIRNLEIYY